MHLTRRRDNGGYGTISSDPFLAETHGTLATKAEIETERTREDRGDGGRKVPCRRENPRVNGTNTPRTRPRLVWDYDSDPAE